MKHNNYGQAQIKACEVTFSPGTFVRIVDNVIMWRVTFKALFTYPCAIRNLI